MKVFITLLLITFTISKAPAQIFKKIKEKAEQAINKQKDKTIQNNDEGNPIAV